MNQIEKKWLLLFWVVVLGLTGSVTLAAYPTRKIHNKTDKRIWVGMYHYYKNKADRKNDPVIIEPGTSKIIETRGKSLTKDRVMVFDYTPEKLKKVLTRDEYDRLSHKRVGLAGSYFIASSTRLGGKLKGYHYIEWKQRTVSKVAKPVIQKTAQLIAEEFRQVKENPYKMTQAKVRVGNQLHPKEKEYLAKRKPKVKLALEKLTGRGLSGKYIPSIALICSGGGYRAMLSSTGFLTGANKIGLLDCATYAVGLSGSTWALGSWLTLGQPIQEFRDKLVQKITKNPFKPSTDDIKLLTEVLGVKFAFQQPVGIVDIYGNLIANRLLPELGSDRFNAYLSQQMKRVENGNWVFPIYTSVEAREETVKDRAWFEHTPYEVGSADYGAYVPTWALGRQFENGTSVDFAPEQTLGFTLGTYGAAFAFDVGTALREVVNKIPNPILKPMMSGLLQQIAAGIASKHIAWVELHNYMKGLPNNKMGGQTRMKLTDAGLAFNLPYPPVSGRRPGRKSDILVFFDQSDAPVGETLKLVENYARQKGLKFPKINYDILKKSAVSIFRDLNDSSVPVVIYMPQLSDKTAWEKYKNDPKYARYKPIDGFDFNNCKFCESQNFTYTPENSNKVMLTTEFTMVANKDKIIEVINWVIDQKSK